MTSRQTDCLDYVIDNPTTGRREIYRDGQLRAAAKKNTDPVLLKYFDARGPWGTFPSHATGVQPQEVTS